MTLRSQEKPASLVDRLRQRVQDYHEHDCQIPPQEAEAAADALDELLEALDPDTLEAIADEIGPEFKHSARADSLRIIARKQREAIQNAVGEIRVPPGPHSGVEAKPGAGAGQEAEKALSLSPQHLHTQISSRCRECGGSGRENWREPNAPKIPCVDCDGKGWIEPPDPAPYCPYGHRSKAQCDCGPIAANE